MWQVALDKNEGVVKRHFAVAVFFAPRGCQRVGGQRTLEISR